MCGRANLITATSAYHGRTFHPSLLLSYVSDLPTTLNSEHPLYKLFSQFPPLAAYFPRRIPPSTACKGCASSWAICIQSPYTTIHSGYKLSPYTFEKRSRTAAEYYAQPCGDVWFNARHWKTERIVNEAKALKLLAERTN